jgi:hypothetical protein
VGEDLTGHAIVAVEVEQRPLEPQRRDGDRAQHDEQAEQGRVTPPEQVVRGDQGSTAPADQPEVDDLAAPLRVLGQVGDLQGLAIDVLGDQRAAGHPGDSFSLSNNPAYSRFCA